MAQLLSKVILFFYLVIFGDLSAANASPKYVEELENCIRHAQTQLAEKDVEFNKCVVVFIEICVATGALERCLDLSIKSLRAGMHKILRDLPKHYDNANLSDGKKLLYRFRRSRIEREQTRDDCDGMTFSHRPSCSFIHSVANFWESLRAC